MIFVGIDIGFDGGLAWVLNSEHAETIAMPSASFDGKRQIDIAVVDSWLFRRAWENVAKLTIERPTRGYKMGWQMGYIQGMLRYRFRGLSYSTVRPQDWQREFGINAKCPGGTKAASIRMCHELFPDVSLRRNDKCRVDHDGMADALLIAEYGRRVHEREAS